MRLPTIQCVSDAMNARDSRRGKDGSATSVAASQSVDYREERHWKGMDWRSAVTYTLS